LVICKESLVNWRKLHKEGKLNNYDEDGKEFIQNILSDGQGYGQ
jgi:hypothetical protein